MRAEAVPRPRIGPWTLPALLAAGLSCNSSAATDPGPAPPAPTISVSTRFIIFAATGGGANPASQVVAIINTGTGSLSGLSVPISYAAGQPAAWLSASLSQATAPASLTLSAASAGLAAGTYRATAAITSAAAGVTNSPVPVSVTFTVSAASAAAQSAMPAIAYANATHR